METYEQFAQVLDEQRYMSLATANAEGSPLAATVFYGYDDLASLYWVASPEAQHSRNIVDNREISISILGLSADGAPEEFSIGGEAIELQTYSGINTGIAVMRLFQLPPGHTIRDSANVWDGAPRRIYRADPFVIYKHSGIDSRETVDLRLLSAVLDSGRRQRLAKVG